MNDRYNKSLVELNFICFIFQFHEFLIDTILIFFNGANNEIIKNNIKKYTIYMDCARVVKK